jgi:hypothetical protein
MEAVQGEFLNFLHCLKAAGMKTAYVYAKREGTALNAAAAARGRASLRSFIASHRSCRGLAAQQGVLLAEAKTVVSVSLARKFGILRSLAYGVMDSANERSINNRGMHA